MCSAPSASTAPLSRTSVARARVWSSGSAAPARAAALRPSWAPTSLSGPLLRSQGRDGLARGQLRRGAHQVRHRHHDHDAGRLHPRHQPLRQRRSSRRRRARRGLRRPLHPARPGNPWTPRRTRTRGRRRRTGGGEDRRGRRHASGHPPVPGLRRPHQRRRRGRLRGRRPAPRRVLPPRRHRRAPRCATQPLTPPARQHPEGTPMNTTPSTTSRVAIVTGGSGGIGRVTAERLAADGQNLAIIYAGNDVTAKSVVEDITAAGGSAIAIKADLDRMHRVNIRGTFVVNQQAARRVRSGGAIVNFSSTVVKLALPTYTAYAATKGAVDAVSVVLAKELHGRDITVNA